VFETHSDQIAAIITEPAMINAGAIAPQPGYLEHLRDVCDSSGAVLIFDEVITGFRLALGGGAEQFGVIPDLATYGKALAGGVPAAAFAGRGEIMERLADDTNHSGTLNGNTLSSAAIIASLRRLKVDPPYERIEAHGSTLMVELRQIASSHGLELNVHGFPMAFHTSFGHADVTDWRSLQRLRLAEYERFSARLIDHGIWVAGRGIWYVSAAHDEAAMTAALDGFDSASAAWMSNATSEL
jgi:glutamate-1-semialdehyde 2,1-aminomutase